MYYCKAGIFFPELVNFCKINLKNLWYTVWRKILTGGNIDKFDEFSTTRHFLYKILHLATYQ